jgi:hypothetical protein
MTRAAAATSTFSTIVGCARDESGPERANAAAHAFARRDLQPHLAECTIAIAVIQTP